MEAGALHSCRASCRGQSRPTERDSATCVLPRVRADFQAPPPSFSGLKGLQPEKKRGEVEMNEDQKVSGDADQTAPSFGRRGAD